MEERERTEPDLAASCGALDALPDPAYLIRRDGRLLYANEAACRFLDRDREALLAQPAAAIDLAFDPASWPLPGSSAVRALKSQHHAREARTFPVEIHLRWARVGGEELVCASVRDLSARVRQAAVLKGRNRVLAKLTTGAALSEVLRTLVESIEEVHRSMVCSVLLLDRESGRLIEGVAPSLPDFYNEAIEGLMIGPEVGSCGAAAHMGRRVIVADVMTHPSWEPFRELARQVGIRACWSEPILSVDKQVLGTFALYYREPRGPTPEELELMRTSADVAGILIQQKRTEEALEAAREAALESARLKSEFLANTSHEIRTPMTAILGFTEELIRRVPAGLEPSELIDHLGTVHRNAKHLLTIIDDILDLSRIEAGRLEIVQERCDVLALLSDVVTLLRPRAEEAGLELELILDRPLPETILSDATRIRQILINLIGNAIKFTERGWIRLSARLDEPARQLEIVVVDSGVGMGPEQLAMVFEAFRQGDSSTSRRFGGSGLGLAISRHLARALSGDLRVESKPREGSRFTLRVATGALEGVRRVAPSEIRGDEPPVVSTARELPGPLHGRVLLAEDGPDNRRLISMILARAGLAVDLAEDGRVACQRVAEAFQGGAPYDLILMDVQMPEMDGYEAIRELRSSGCTTPIVALTAHAMTGDRDRSLACGADDHATKPIRAASLLQLVADHLDKRI
ncbi:MAG: ATP-binding protein [Myxococcota bacterium]